MTNKKDQGLDSKRLNLSLGLLAAYVAYIAFFLEKFNYENSGMFLKIIYSLTVVYWGFANLFLLIFVLFYATELKFKDRGKVEIVRDVRYRISPRIKEFVFDFGVDSYISAIFFLFFQIIPMTLANQWGNSPLTTFLIYLGLVVLISIVWIFLRYKTLKSSKRK